MRTLLHLAALFWGFASAELRAVEFGPLDPDNTNPADFWLPVENPIPEDYVSTPRFPVVPSPGAIAMDIIEELYPNGTARPSGIWQKNLWGFEWKDIHNWNAIYPYPYTVSVKYDNINLMYSGAPVNQQDNSRMIFGNFTVPDDVKPPIKNASYPYLTMSAAFDFGVLIYNGHARLKSITEVAAVIEYVTDAGATVAEFYAVKGSPFINIKCTNAQIGFGSRLPGVPPVISINSKPPGTPVFASSFKMQVAVGPVHPQGEFWHAYFDSNVELLFPDPPTTPTNVSQPYTGLLQIACGEVGDMMGTLLDQWHGAYATGANVNYAVDTAANMATVTFQWNQQGNGNLVMLALPHHLTVLKSASPQPTPYWCVKGNLSAVTGSSWNMEYPLTTKGFGETLMIDPAMRDALREQMLYDYELYVDKCPGDNITGQNISGWKNMELYAYVRDLARYTDVAIIAENLGFRPNAVNLTKKVVSCLAPILKRPAKPPQPCELPKNNTLTCLRDMMDVFYDTNWGGLITGWYSRFSEHYCECDKGSPTACEGLNYCDNVDGWSAFSNYGNPFYNDHHFQYGYLVKSIAWPLYFQVRKGVDLGMSAELVKNFTKQGLAFARDYANPSATKDKYFPQMRHKDVFDGHSWAEGYDYSGRILTWVNQQSSGEAINSYYSLYLLGLALNDTNVADWGRINLATEMNSLKTYTHLSNATQTLAQQPTPAINKMKKCISILIGNGLNGATYYGPNELFECGITVIPISPITREWVDPSWAQEAFSWIQARIPLDGLCVFPNPLNMTSNPCGGSYGPDWWGNEWGCCPTNEGYPWNQWRAFPDWFPTMYVIQGFADPKAAWENLQVKDLTHPNPPALPFPYVNRWGTVVGYAADLSRTVALFTVATHSN